MIERNTVLVLGAGASMAYGLPSGAALKRKILNCSVEQLRELPYKPGIATRMGIEEEFLESFRRSHVPSIDSFLASRRDFMELGKLAIASTLLPMESDKKLLDQEPDDHWYQYLVEALHAPWDEFENNKLAIVTFNYDRSLELFLETTLAHRHNKEIGEVRQKLTCIPILHVYGSLGSLSRGSANFVPYGCTKPNCVAAAASGLLVIEEGRDNSPEFVRARQLIADAEVLGFLGFGFDETNVRRLGGQQISAAGSVQSGQIRFRPFKATALGLTPAQRRRAALAINHPELRDPNIEQHFEDRECLEMLRHTLLF